MFQISLFIFESKIRKRTTKINPPYSFTEHFTSYPDYYIYERKKEEEKIEENEEKRS